MDEVIVMCLKGLEERCAQKEDEESLFGGQIATTLQRFNNRQKAQAKLLIQQVLLDIEFSDLDQQQHDYRHGTGYMYPYESAENMVSKYIII